VTEPTTVNVGFIIPNTGDLVDTWGEDALNPDFVALDGFIGGVVTITAASLPITLTSPAGAVITPGAGPVQSQNRVLRFNGALGANVQVTLPLPGEYIIQNLTTGNFVLSFRAATLGKIVATPQGSSMRVFNDGTDCFLQMDKLPGESLFLNGVSAVPAWITACTVKPFLLEDGTIYNMSDYPYLGGLLGSKFGGNGSTTFAVPDSRARSKLSYDGGANRVTAAISGIDGQTIGAVGGDQRMQQHLHTGTTNSENQSHNHDSGATPGQISVPSGFITVNIMVPGHDNTGVENQNHQHSFNTGNTGSGNSQNMPPAIVAGIWLIATGQ
jgi:microcystin-dependent protein